MRIAITGADGRLGRSLRAALGAEHDVVALNRAALDLERPESVGRLASTGADLVIHPAAYTNVDGCARDPHLAYRVNALGTKYVALACRELDAALVYVSTNEVFDGAAARPYLEYDQARPVNPYGWSKWAGEQAVRDHLSRFYIARVAWLFGGERNFVRTVLRLADERGELSVVDDEVGSPTSSDDAAAAIAALIRQPVYGVYHVVNAGHASRFDLAAAALRLSGRANVTLSRSRLADFRRDSVVPPYTPLANMAGAALGITLRPWEEALEEYVGALQRRSP